MYVLYALDVFVCMYGTVLCVDVCTGVHQHANGAGQILLGTNMQRGRTCTRMYVCMYVCMYILENYFCIGTNRIKRLSAFHRNLLHRICSDPTPEHSATVVAREALHTYIHTYIY